MKVKTHFPVIIAFLVASVAFCNDTIAQKKEIKKTAVSGYVFWDSNQNGIKDNNEEGIKNVTVSDQVNVVFSDENGYYLLNSLEGFGIVFISVPNGFAVTKSFWQKISPEQNNTPVNFPLLKTKPVSSFSFLQASDTHISEKSIDRMDKFRSIVDSVKPDLVLITGDLVKDALRVPEKEATGYYELFQREIQKIKQPVWLVPGNHEIFGIERHLSLVSPKHPLYGRNMYRHYFGPDYYSFNYGGVHFIAINSLEFEDLWYYGRIDSTQLEWLKRDVALLSPTVPVVTFQHVPFYCGGMSIAPFEKDGLGRSLEKEKGVLQYRHIVSNAQEVLAILKNNNFPLALAGHYHYQQKFSLEGVQTRFEQTAAIIGPSEEGIIKMPSGVTLYHVTNGKIDEGKFIRLDK
ncbi:MAG: metallophosphoesterase [Sphingobacteriales bacterium]